MFFHVIFALPVLPEGVHAYQCTNGNSFLGAGVALTGTLGVHVCEPPTQPHPREAHMGLSPGWRGPGEASPVEATRCLVSESILFMVEKRETSLNCFYLLLPQNPCPLFDLDIPFTEFP